MVISNQATKPSVAVVGSGVAGLSAAWHLKDQANVTLFESESRAGGHAHTVDVTVAGKTFGVDTGFLVFNHRTYPGITPFFDALGVVTAKSDMGFSVQASDASDVGKATLEWAGNDLNSVFTQRKNLFKPDFWAMLRDIVRFNKAATAYALNPPNTLDTHDTNDRHETLGEYLQANGYSNALRDWYLVPMAAAIWSCPTATMMGYPMATFARFCHNHGLLQIANRPQWYTVQGGSRNYVNKVLATLPDVRLDQAVTHIARDSNGVDVHTTAGVTRFDAVVLACHSDQALHMVDASAKESALLGSIGYQNNTAVLHTDASLLPSQRRAWAAWNYETRQSKDAAHSQQQVCLHYLLNKLQPLPVGDAHPVIVSLNPLPQHLPHPDSVLQTFEYAHPVFNSAAIAAQNELPSIQGDRTSLRTWFAGAWTNYGFHEDGFQSGKAAAHSLLRTIAA